MMGNVHRIVLYPLLGMLFLCLFSCGYLWQKNEEKHPLARVGDIYLYREDLVGLIGEEMTPQDSVSFVSNYINTWATKQLLLSRARINLSEAQLGEFNRLVENYRTDLYTRAYKEALVVQAEDTMVSNSELREFYTKERENFKLKDKLLKLRFAELPKQFMNKDEVILSLQRFNEEDREYLDSVGVQFRKLNFNDSLWVPASRIIQEIPPLTFENENRYLNKSQFFELEDTLGVYLAKVLDVREINETAPFPFIEPTIRQVLLNRRKLEYIRKLENEIIDEAIKRNEFEVYERND